MVKLFAKCMLSLFGWMFLICGTWLGATFFVCWMLNFGETL